MVDNLALAIAHLMLGFFAWRAFMMDDELPRTIMRRGRQIRRRPGGKTASGQGGERPHA